MEKTTITYKGEIIGIFWFKTKEESAKFGEEVALAFKSSASDGYQKVEELIKRYKSIKPYANFFRYVKSLLIERDEAEAKKD